jgi:hypothetical protein
LNKLPLKRRVLIVGEGRETEYNYFVGFRNAFEEELRATATSVSVARGKGGDAHAIVKKAIYEAKKFSPDPKRGDRVFLQGQRTLNSSAGKDLEKVVLIPTTTATSHRDTLAI